MAFRRRMFRRGGRRRAKRGGKKLATVNTVKRLISKRQEHKYQLGTLDATAMPATGTVSKLETIAQGSTDSDRVGDEMHITRISIRGSVIVNNTAVYNRARFICFQWKPDDTSLSPTVSMILNNTANTTQLVEGITNHDRSQQFNVLFDRTFTVNYNGRAIQEFRKVISPKLYKKDLKFTSGANTGSNQLYVLYVGDQVTNTPLLNLQMQVQYTDS